MNFPAGHRPAPFWAVIAAMLTAAIAGCSQLGSPIRSRSSLRRPSSQGQLVGGGTRQMAPDAHPVSGFLPHPKLLTPGGSGEAALNYRNPNADVSAYHKVLLDPVAIAAGAGSDLSTVPDEQKKALADTLYADLFLALDVHCEMVRQPEPHTLRLRFALVDVREPNAAINTIATYGPYASTAYTLTSLAFNKGVGYFAGTATGEGYGTDAMDGTLLWQAIDKRGGTTAMVADTLDNWRDVHHVFEAWGILLSTRLQQMGVCRR